MVAEMVSVRKPNAHFEHIQATPGFSLVWRDVHEGFDSYPTHLLAIFRKTGPNS